MYTPKAMSIGLCQAMSAAEVPLQPADHRR